MKKLLFIGSIAVIAMATIATTSCGSGTKKQATADSALNITIYLDLSDRVVRDLTPSQTERDIAIVQHIAELFKEKSLGPQLLQSRNQLKVMFYPTPNNSEIANIANRLNVDLEKTDVKERRPTLDSLSETFRRNLEQVYAQTIQDKHWLGSDIWGFFDTKKVDEQCVKPNSRNILVILTDGYLYYVPNQLHDGTAYNYIVPQNLERMDSLMVSRTGLDNLEVLMLEVNPYQPTQRTKMISLLENWFKGMGVRKFVVADTDLPSNTRTVIDNFFNQE